MTSLELLRQRIAALKSDNDMRLGELKALAREGKTAEQALNEAESLKDVLDRAVGVLNSVS